MVRILGYLIAVAALVGGAVWMADNPGLLTVRWLSWRLDAPVPVALLALLVLVIAATLAWRFVSGFLGLPGAFARRARERRQLKGTAALAGALTALAGGEHAAARRCLKDADKALKNPQLTHLVAAQIDRDAGDRVAAAAHYRALLDPPETELAGLRGLVEGLPPGDPEAARLAARAFARAPGAAWAARAAYAAEMSAGRLEAAGAALTAARKKGGWDDDAARAERLRLALARAQGARGEGRLSDAAKLAREALEISPGNEEAALILARVHDADGRGKKAAEVLERQWEIAPSPALLAAWLELWREEDAAAQMQRVRDLAAANPTHPESHFALAEAALRAELPAEARTALTPLLGPEAKRADAGRAALAMARVLAAEGSDAAAQREWIERAAQLLAAA
jgi:HemY protein